MRRIASAIAVVTLFVCLPLPADDTTSSTSEFQPGAFGMKLPVITSRKDLDLHLGKLVAIRGPVDHRSKQPTVLGVDVRNPTDGPIPDAYAVGILIRHDTTPEQHDETIRLHGQISSRGAGISYMLYFNLVGELAATKPWPAATHTGG